MSYRSILHSVYITGLRKVKCKHGLPWGICNLFIFFYICGSVNSVFNLSFINLSEQSVIKNALKSNGFKYERHPAQ